MTAVEVERLWKTFQIPHERRTTLFENLAGLLKPRQYEEFTVLKDVSFQVEKGECVGIIGDNGSGKSTLLKIIANILRPTRGAVRVKGKMTPFLELGVGFQPDLSVRENVGVYATVMGVSQKDIIRSTDEVIKFAGLDKFEDTKLKNLSSGMQVRLAFSTAIQTDPEVMLVDEVLAVGDMEFQQKCFDVFNRYRREGVTILFVSHDLGAVRRFCDRTLLLGGGEQRAFGETGEILDKYVYCRSEKEATAPDPAQDSSSPNRWGNGKVTITDVEFLDKFGIKGSRVNSMDPLTIRIHYHALEEISDITFGIALHSEDGRHLFGTNTKIKQTQLRVSPGDGYIDLNIENMPLLSGKFLLSPAAQSLDYMTTYDWIDKQYSFDVIPTSGDAGIMAISCDWAD
ncbi:MAG TPA: ABC transporter ATP-binding protein [Methanotrichaceae archaeon]|nr:ABC transporter ATP-binding protein [Methanotrichaceae archaeon]HQF15834.1 ABC transporter ATP-binding protein [Methanotrichaceae archaeon]HQI90490.1 ABC transporter ATP-binding protein [Methanotrichaceae archaeon]HQJ28121.1 ABC transporter ATP-binding protein [Methanotrichaceae archaeon]